MKNFSSLSPLSRKIAFHVLVFMIFLSTPRPTPASPSLFKDDGKALERSHSSF